ncbi:hypothetical protein AX14_012999 [Amanita brunnescens Koide BX004]|nr:hypothetical protein AX14_012999 [Amanita brunnescens Koide BX004]
MLERAQTACHSSNADSNHCTMCSEVPVLMPGFQSLQQYGDITPSLEDLVKVIDDLCEQLNRVLQHIADPRPGVKRDAVYLETASMTWYPPSKGIKAWWALSKHISRPGGGNPHPGGYIHVWAEKAAVLRRGRIGGIIGGEGESSSGLAKAVVEEGFATREEIDKMVEAWSFQKMKLYLIMIVKELQRMGEHCLIRTSHMSSRAQNSYDI